MDAINTKTETTSPSSVDPKTVACPTCNVPIGGECRNLEEGMKGVPQFVNWFHVARVEAAINAANESVSEPEPKREPEPEQEWDDSQSDEETKSEA